MDTRDPDLAHRLWRLTVLHERRIVVRGARARDARPTGASAHRALLPDFAGADAVSVRAVAPSGETCAVAATLPGGPEPPVLGPMSH